MSISLHSFISSKMSVNDHSYALFFKNSRHDGSTDENIDYTEKLKTAIEVQMIDTNLYMSKELWLPTGGRSVFGGQVQQPIFA